MEMMFLVSKTSDQWRPKMAVASGGASERKITSAVYDGEISVMMKRR